MKIVKKAISWGVRKAKAIIRWSLRPVQIASRSKYYNFKKHKMKEEAIIQEAKKIPCSSGQRFYKKSPLKIGVICDQFFYDSFFACCNLVYISSKNWEKEISGIQCLLVLSTWSGIKGGDWTNMNNCGSQTANIFNAILNYCKLNGIKTVFYSKEDPVNYDRFIGTAQKCEYVLTTCKEVVDQYKKDCGHDNVFVLEFGINPIFHNPIGIKAIASKQIIFSGAWRTKYPERCKDLKAMLDGVIQAGREPLIIDRDFADNYDRFSRFPKEYVDYANKAVDHMVLQNIHKLFAWAINVNSVTDSETMFANRIYELQANGNILLSNKSIGVHKKFPNVFIIEKPDDVARVLDSLTDAELFERRVSSIRRVMTGETCFDRFALLCKHCGLPQTVTERRVLVAAPYIDEAVQRCFDAQSYPNKELTLESSLSAEKILKYDMLAYFDPKRFYGVNYLEDMINAFKYTDSDFIQKPIRVDSLEQQDSYCYRSSPADKYRCLFWVTERTAQHCQAKQFEDLYQKGFEIDPFNYAP